MDEIVRKKLDAFFETKEKRGYSKNDILLEPGAEVTSVFYLTRGKVRMYGSSKDGLEHTLNIFQPKSFFPVGPVVNQTANPYYYAAMEMVEVRKSSAADLIAFLRAEPDVVFDLLQRIYKGLEGYFLRMESLLSEDAYHKTIVQLVISARRFAKKDKEEFEMTLTHNQIAQQTGLSRETVTREVKKLQNKKLVTYTGRTLKIMSLETLEQELFT